MTYFKKFKTIHLSSEIQMEIFHVHYKGVYIKISNISTRRGIMLWNGQLCNLIEQLKQRTKPDIEHPFNWSHFLVNGDFYIKKIPFTEKFLLVNKSCARIVLDRFSVESLISMQIDLIIYMRNIESRYDQID